jgi:hypothetical protein
VRIRWWRYWQYRRAMWALQICQYGLGLVRSSLQVIRSQGRALQTVIQLRLSQKLLSVKQHFYWLMGPVWVGFRHFHEMTPKQLLFFMKFGTNFVKVALTCKVSRWDFLLGQTRNVLWSTRSTHESRWNLVMTCIQTLGHFGSLTCYKHYQGLYHTLASAGFSPLWGG